ncbi:MAG: SatD family protein [Myxococcota bacterium]|nr:SatD family protein [Myxococcota bacterium]
MGIAQYILMGDVVASSKYVGKTLQQDLGTVVKICNQRQEDAILSPFTVTLGDEFQGIAKDLPSAIACIFEFEDTLLSQGGPFQLRYVLHQGVINTPINTEIAYAMLGPGLTRARKMLTDKKRRKRQKFNIELVNVDLSRILSQLFFVLEGLQGRWKKKDYELINSMLESSNNGEIGAKFGKNRSQIWKRRRQLMIDEVKTIKSLIAKIIHREPGAP